MAILRPVGARRNARQGLVPRCWGGSQNNGVPCIWTPSREVHIFHGDNTQEIWQGEEKASGRVSLAPAMMRLGDAWLCGQPHARSLHTPGSWVLAHEKAVGAQLPQGTQWSDASWHGSRGVHRANRTQTQLERPSEHPSLVWNPAP